MNPELPKVVSNYFDAANTNGAADRVAACFATDAEVHDEGQDVRGRPAIRAWAEAARRKYRFHAAPTAAEAADGRTVVTAHLTGDFPGAPADLRYRFLLTGDEIAVLEIH
jgi:hypothetical protein